jgi:hypothetical protein
MLSEQTRVSVYWIFSHDKMEISILIVLLG